MTEKTVDILIAAYRQAKANLPFDQQTDEGRAALVARIFSLAEDGEHNVYKLISAAVKGGDVKPPAQNRSERHAATHLR